MISVQKHKCRAIELVNGKLGWTAICPHLGLAAQAEDWPEAKANLAFTIRSYLAYCAKKKQTIPSDVLRGDATYQDYQVPVAVGS